MLILTRKPLQRIFFDTQEGRIELMILSYHRGQVRIGIEAPSSIDVSRDDIIKGKDCDYVDKKYDIVDKENIGNTFDKDSSNDNNQITTKNKTWWGKRKQK